MYRYVKLEKEAHLTKIIPNHLVRLVTEFIKAFFDISLVQPLINQLEEFS